MKLCHEVSRTTFFEVLSTLRLRFLRESRRVHTERWQGASIAGRPEAAMHELLNVNFTVPLNGINDLDHWRRDIRPNLPWADDHFLERVSGEPLNPGVQWAKWPWSNSANSFRNEDGQFNHTYMERLWPKYAGYTSEGRLSQTVYDFESEFYCPEKMEKPHFGIRWWYGDLEDLVGLLVVEPLTRQAWIPLFLPEDTGVGDGGRKPCTLGYQFMVRENSLHIYYPLRSCDYYRHLQDDIYLAVRLGLWVIDQCALHSDFWKSVIPGSLSMHCTSLHVFRNDFIAMGGQQS